METASECDHCNNTCATCESYNKCLSCSESLYLQDNLCLESCNGGYEADSSTNTCVQVISNGKKLTVADIILIVVGILVLIVLILYYLFRVRV